MPFATGLHNNNLSMSNNKYKKMKPSTDFQIVFGKIIKITSLQNSKVKQLVQLRNRRARTKTGLTIVEGCKEVSAALDARAHFKELYIHSDYLSKEGKGVVKNFTNLDRPIFQLSKSVFDKVSYGDRNEGILATCETKEMTLSDLSESTQGIYLVVEHVEKPGNLGAILRTCDGAGVNGVIICEGITDIYNPNVIRASLGTCFSVNVVTASNEEAFKFLKTNKVKVFAAFPNTQVNYTKVNFKTPHAIVLGSEDKGLSEFWKQKCDQKIKIPMYGCADSLNVSASASVLLYEAIRQRS